MVTEVTDAELLSDLRSSPRGQQIVAERQEARLAARRSLVAERAEVIHSLEANYPKVVAVEAKLDGQILGAEERLQALRQSAGASEERRLQNRLGHQLTQLDGELVRGAPAEIDNFRHEMMEEWEQLRNRGPDVSPARRNALGVMAGGSSNLESFSARLRGLMAAPAAAEALKVEAIDAAELGKRLDKIRAGIPEVGPMVEA